MKRITIRAVFWLLLAVGLVLGGIYAFMPKPIEVDIVIVERGELVVTIDEDGKTRIKDRYVVSTPVGGRLMRIKHRPGDPVEEGTTVLASILPSNPTILDARSLAEIDAKVKASEAAVSRTSVRIQYCEAQLELSRKQFDRFSKLFQQSSISKSEFDSAKADLTMKTEDARASKFDRDIANFELDLARAAQVQINADPDQEQQFTIMTPVAGRVLRVFKESSTVVLPGTELLEIGDPRDLEVEVDVLSTDAVRISPGNRVWLEHWGGDHALHGTVRRIEPAAYTRISALGVEEQRVNIMVDFNEPSDQISRLGDGFRVEAKIVIWERKDVLLVPASALFRSGNQWAVFVVSDNTAKLTTIEIGRRNESDAEVIRGLSPDQQVVIHPGDQLVDGAKVVQRPSGEVEDL